MYAVADHLPSGLAWHTEEGTLRQKFEEFGAVEEAVSSNTPSAKKLSWIGPTMDARHFVPPRP